MVGRISRGQLKKGDGYDLLKPAYSLWLLGEALRTDIKEALHRFRLQDEKQRTLVEHGGIWVVELSKCTIDVVRTERDRWLKFFVEGERLDDARLPAWMHTEEMQQAMSTLQAFSEQERAYHRYQARQDYLRQQKSIEHYWQRLRADVAHERAEKARERAEKEVALVEKRERAEKEMALAEIERLNALIKVISHKENTGFDPHSRT